MLRRLKRSGKAGFAGTHSEHRTFNLTTDTILSLFSTGRTCSSSLVTPARPPVSSSLGLQITNHYFTYASPYLWNQLPSSFRQLFTLLPVHLILRISRPFTPDLKLISFTNPFLHSHSFSFRTAFTDLNLYWIRGTGVVCFSFSICARLSWMFSFRVHSCALSLTRCVDTSIGPAVY